MTISPRAKYLLVSPQKEELEDHGTTASGIIVETGKDRRPDLAVSKATLIAVGSDAYEGGFREGDVVLYNYFSGNQFLVRGIDPLGKDDITYHLIHQEDILAKVEDK